MSWSGFGRAPLGVLVASLFVACAATPWTPPSVRPPASPEVIARFRLGPDDDRERRAVEGPAIVGAEPAPPSAETLARDVGATSGGDVVIPNDAVGESDGVLRLESVVRSVETHFPLVLAALEEVEIAAGNAESAAGAFDTRLSASGLFELEGFYESDRIDVGVEQPTTLWGTTFSAGWRRGDGSFAVYDGKAKTDEDGEIRAGALLPLLQGRPIDPQRVALWRARLEQSQADPRIVTQRLAATRKAADAYWKWVAWGQKRRIARNLLRLAEARQEQVRLAVETGQLAEINLTDNERLIVDRTSGLVRAEQGLQQAAIELSLYWRGEQGQPRVPGGEELPRAFPTPRQLDEVLVDEDEVVALSARPELHILELEVEQLRLDLDLARNEMLPNVDVGLFASQDLGDAVNVPDDKGDFELEAVLRFQLPLQRRQPRGARRATEAKIGQLEQEIRFVRDLVVSEVRGAVTALGRTLERLDQARRNVELARDLEEAERLQLDLGESDLFRLNLREQQTAVAAAALVDVVGEHFRALAAYRAVLGLPYDEVVAGQPVGGTAP